MTNIETLTLPKPELEASPQIRFGDIGIIKGHNFEQPSLLLPATQEESAGAIAIISEVDEAGNKRTRYGLMGSIDDDTVIEDTGHVEYDEAVRMLAHSMDRLYADEKPKDWALEWATHRYPNPVER